MRCYNQLDRWSLRAAAGVVTVCGKFAEDLKARGIPANRITVRHNSVKPFTRPDEAAIEAVRKTLPADVPLLLVVGRFSKEKGHADFVNAIDILRRNSKHPFHAVLVGDGPEEAPVRALIDQLGLSGFITMAGLRHDVRPYYAIASIVVMPSHSEGSPNVLLEAMAAGVPVVATRAGGVPEIATDGETAVLCEIRNPQSLAVAMQRMLEDPALRARIAANAKDLATREYSPEAYRRSLTGIFLKALGEPHA
jgi:glycosyltransferase involved in cell wall biosynthesis